MYGDHENDYKAKDKKHMTMYEAAEMAREADVNEMWLTHYSPSMVKPQKYENEVKKIFPRTVIAKDRELKELKFDE